MVSHSTAVKKEELAKIDILPKIKDRFLLTPELSPTFAKKDDDLIEIWEYLQGYLTAMVMKVIPVHTVIGDILSK